MSWLTLWLLITSLASATVVWGNPMNAKLQMNDADSAWAEVSSIEYTCPNQAVASHSVNDVVNLIAGLSLPSGLDDDCAIEIFFVDAFVVEGGDGGWSIEVDEVSVVLDAPNQAVTLDWTLLTGSPSGSPSMIVP